MNEDKESLKEKIKSLTEEVVACRIAVASCGCEVTRRNLRKKQRELEQLYVDDGQEFEPSEYKVHFYTDSFDISDKMEKEISNLEIDLKSSEENQKRAEEMAGEDYGLGAWEAFYYEQYILDLKIKRLKEEFKVQQNIELLEKQNN